MQTATMNREAIVAFTIKLLAQEQGVSEETVRADLEQAGPHLPIDSIKLTEVLARVEVAFRVKLPATVTAARSLRSLHTFADMILAVEAGK
jgi:acyl carrier protein